jgi:putative selenium metabolism protein SsnA
MPPPLLLKHGIIADPSPSAPRVLYDHALLIEDGRIARIAPYREFDGSDVPSLDCSGRLILPGFINIHTHLYSTFARGLHTITPAADFTGVLKNLWWKLDRALTVDACYYSAIPVLLEAIRCGTTTIVDHHASPLAVRGSLDALQRALKDTGMRGCLCYEVSDRDGEKVAEEGIEENAGFLAACAKNDGGMLSGLFGLHASFTLSDKTLERAVTAARSSGAGFHTHVAEARADQETTHWLSGSRVVERLHRTGVLGERTIAAHAVHVNDAEMDLLASTGTVVAHNPQSNMNNAVGIADLEALRSHGVVVGLGTDAMTHDMRQELRAGLWAQRLKQESPSAGFTALTEALWQVNPMMAGRLFGAPVGTMAPGAAADLIALEYDPATPLTNDSLPGHLVFGITSAQVDTTIIGGRVVMHQRKLRLDLDEKEVMAKVRETASEVWGRLSN